MLKRREMKKKKKKKKKIYLLTGGGAKITKGRKFYLFYFFFFDAFPKVLFRNQFINDGADLLDCKVSDGEVISKSPAGKQR